VAQRAGDAPAAVAPAAPDNAAAPAAAAVDPDKVVLKVGDSTMTAGEFEAFCNSLPQEVQFMARGPAKRRVGEDLIKLKVLAAEARKKGLDQTPQFKQQVALMVENVLAGALINDLEGTLVSDQEIQAYYDEHKNEYERATARHILIGVGPDTGLNDAQAKAKADEIRARLQKGEDFAALAKTNSADPGSKDDGGLLQPFTRGTMVPEFEQAAFGQKANEISQPVKTRFGYHIIQTQKVEVPPLADVKDEIAEALRPQRLEAFVEDLRKQANPHLDETFFGPPQPAAEGPVGALGQ
jgi:peptidyl-prolyl cis-trans isomerase C